MDEFHNMDINSALNIVQFVEICEKIWYNKASETNTFWTEDKQPESGLLQYIVLWIWKYLVRWQRVTFLLYL